MMKKKMTKLERDKAIFWLLSNSHMFANDYASDVHRKCEAALGFTLSKTAIREALKDHRIPYKAGVFQQSNGTMSERIAELEERIVKIENWAATIERGAK